MHFLHDLKPKKGICNPSTYLNTKQITKGILNDHTIGQKMLQMCNKYKKKREKISSQETATPMVHNKLLAINCI